MVNPLETALGYRFAGQQLLEQALTHRSAGGRNNERMEFLGDSILGMVIAEQLYQRFPKAREGELSRRRAAIVKGATLAEIAREIGLGEHLRLGQGELKSGGFRRDSILADTLEALIAAIYLESGIEAAREVIGRLFGRRLEESPAATTLKDPKTALQEYLQGRKLELPCYELLSVEGEAHNQQFNVECRVAALGITTQGSGGSRKGAEQQAAERALQAAG